MTMSKEIGPGKEGEGEKGRREGGGGKQLSC